MEIDHHIYCTHVVLYYIVGHFTFNHHLKFQLIKKWFLIFVVTQYLKIIMWYENKKKLEFNNKTCDIRLSSINRCQRRWGMKDGAEQWLFGKGEWRRVKIDVLYFLGHDDSKCVSVILIYCCKQCRSFIDKHFYHIWLIQNQPSLLPH